MPRISIKVEQRRGCGYRKKGGIYFVSDGIGSPCDKLPIELTVCPTCSCGIKQARGFTWITSALFENKSCSGDCERCPLNLKDLRLGLMWVGTKYYPTPADFSKEASAMGVSKRISQVPKDFVVGETWIALAHPKAIVSYDEKNEPVFTPGIFRAFRPARIEYVVKETETKEELEALEKRGLTLVKVVPSESQPEMQFENDEDL